MTDNEEFEEAMGIAEEFDRMTCQEQVRLVLDMLTDAAKEDDMDKVRAALIPLTLIANRQQGQSPRRGRVAEPARAGRLRSAQARNTPPLTYGTRCPAISPSKPS